MNKVFVFSCLILLGFFGNDIQATESQEMTPEPLERYTLGLMSALKANLPEKPQVSNGESCRVSVKQGRSGYIQELRVLKCSSGTLGNLVLRAIIAASPLPQPESSEDFQEEVTIVYIVDN
ncbi:TonB C-terminal domain-containing protein [Pseudidiomarina gelatinasegens]|uniref:TonB C-terminal domain-containing protein n=1 Tax=Pseudidiomarina gelatinasegens TaxID=2487740 RepID=UPI003A96F170